MARRQLGRTQVGPEYVVRMDQLEDQLIMAIAATGYVHDQPMSATQWVVQHDLGFDPAGIAVIDAEGNTLEGWAVTYDSPGSALRILLDLPLAGRAHFS